MAINFAMWIECATHADLNEMINHFKGLSHTLINGRKISWGAGAEENDPLAMTVSSRDLSSKGVRTIQDALETTEAALWLFHHLSKGPSFRYAWADWEPYSRPLVELSDYVQVCNDGSCSMEMSCVLDEALFEELGKPRFFQTFRQGYQWHPYRGESYNPLGSNDHPELWELQKRLLPNRK